MRHSTRLFMVLVLGVLLAACGGAVPGGGDGDGANGGGNGQGTDATSEPAASLVAQHGGSTGLMQFVEIGSCFWVLGEEPNLTDIVEIVSCDEEHEYEMFGKIDVPGDARPSDQELADLAAEECGEDVFEDYVGAAPDDSRYRSFFVAPTEEEWAAGMRTIQCTLFDPEEESTSGPARDSGE